MNFLVKSKPKKVLKKRPNRSAYLGSWFVIMMGIVHWVTTKVCKKSDFLGSLLILILADLCWKNSPN
jgi:hypothetical protein